MFDLLIGGYFAFSFCFKFICVAICSHCLRARPQNFSFYCGVWGGGGGGGGRGMCLLLVLVSAGQGAFEGCAWHVHLLKEMKYGIVKAWDCASLFYISFCVHACTSDQCCQQRLEEEFLLISSLVSVASWKLRESFFSFPLASVASWNSVKGPFLLRPPGLFGRAPSPFFKTYHSPSPPLPG